MNLAVNNLLSRDEEDGDDADDAQDNYVPEVSWNQSLLKHKPRKSCAFLRTGHPNYSQLARIINLLCCAAHLFTFIIVYFQDLISLLDAGINADHPSVIIDVDAMFSEDMFGYAAQSRAARSSGT